jgi:uncharacterized RmlC-like cupin family protein
MPNQATGCVQTLGMHPFSEGFISKSAINSFKCDYPSRSVALKVNHQSEQGYIVNLREGVSNGVAIIESNAGAVRSNHYHKEDAHTLYLVSGALLYFERPVGKTTIGEPIIITPGQMFYTGPMVEHAIVFLYDSTMISVSARQRDHKSHEEDVVRVSYLDNEQAAWWCAWGRARVTAPGTDPSSGLRRKEHVR